MADPTVTTAVDAITSSLNLLTASVNTEAFRHYGMRLSLSLAFLSISYTGVVGLISGKSVNELLGEAIQLFIVCGLVLWAVSTPEVFNFIKDGFDLLAVAILNGVPGVSVGTTEEGFKAALGALVATSYQFFTEGFGTAEATFAGLAENAVALIYRFFTAIMFLMMTLFYLASFVATQAILVIAAVMAPLMIPFYIVPPLSFIGDAWFRFVISAGFQKLVGALILALTLGLVREVTRLADTMASGTTFQFGLFSALFLVVGILAYMMSQSLSIGAGLVVGSAGGLSSVVPRGMSPAAMASRGGSMTTSAARTAGRGASAAGGAAASAIRNVAGKMANRGK